MSAFMISLPKAGTQLFKNMIQAEDYIALQPNAQNVPAQQFKPYSQILPELRSLDRKQNYVAHLPTDDMYEIVLQSWDHIYLVIRDPKDIIVSMAHYIERFPLSVFNWKEKHGIPIANLLWEARVNYLIDYLPPFLKCIYRWIRCRHVHVISYEHYQEDPDKVIEMFAGHGHGTVEEIRARSLQKQFTYREGKTGGWRVDMTEKQAAKFYNT